MYQSPCPHCRSLIGTLISINEKSKKSFRLANRLQFCPNCYQEVKVNVKHEKYLYIIIPAYIVTSIYYLGTHVAAITDIPLALLYLAYSLNNREFTKGAKKYDTTTKTYT